MIVWIRRNDNIVIVISPCSTRFTERGWSGFVGYFNGFWKSTILAKWTFCSADDKGFSRAFYHEEFEFWKSYMSRPSDDWLCRYSKTHVGKAEPLPRWTGNATTRASEADTSYSPKSANSGTNVQICTKNLGLQLKSCIWSIKKLKKHSIQR